MKSGYHIRAMSFEEVRDVAIAWATREGWNPGLHDAECFYVADPDSFLVGELDGRVIACISAVNYQNEFGFIGFYIVHPDYRGVAYGYELAKVALERLQGVNIGVDGLINQVENYKRYGFKLAYRNVRFQGLSAQSTLPSQVPVVQDSDFEDVCVYDRRFFPAGRKEFLRKWIFQEGGKSLLIRDQDRLVGYGTIRPCAEGFKIGPLFADDSDIAEELLLSLRVSIPGDSIFYLDIPEPNEAANSLTEKYKMTKVFETARMYNHTIPDLPIERIFGITSFELG